MMSRAKTCLMIMNAREIPECILSLKALKIDKVWFRGFTEPQLGPKIDEFVRSTDYDRYIIVSDDTIVTQQALDNLLALQDSGPVVTGWCNIFPGQTMAALEFQPVTQPRRLTYINMISHVPKLFLPVLRFFYHHTPIKRLMNWILYKHFPSLDFVWTQPELFETFFVQWALTSMTREIWQRFPFHYPTSDYARNGSDAYESIVLYQAGIKMLCARDSFIYHLADKRNFIVGKVTPCVIFEPRLPQGEKEESHPYQHQSISVVDVADRKDRRAQEDKTETCPNLWGSLPVELVDEIEQRWDRDKVPTPGGYSDFEEIESHGPDGDVERDLPESIGRDEDQVS